MRNYTHFLLLLCTLIITTNLSFADTLQGRIVGIADGDTVTIVDNSNTQWKVRLMGIDAPEKHQAFGNKSKKSLSDLIFNKYVMVEYNKKDKYGRTIGKIVIDGIDVNFEQVKAGMAWHYKQYQKEQSTEDRFSYAQAEEQARKLNSGLWIDVEPIPPWEYRKVSRGKHP